MKSALTWGALALLLLSPLAAAKPIAFAKGRTVMAEYGAGTMNEFQAFYAPTYWSSVGVGWTELESTDGVTRRSFSYVRGSLLAHRWNLPSAPATVFVGGGLGRASGNDFDTETSRVVGAQFDYETRRVYASFKTDLQESEHTSNRIDTLQLGWAPYEHDYDTLATWIVVQGRAYTGGIYDGTETALLVRLFKGGTWVEAGVTSDRKLQAMMMFNF